MNLLTKIAGSQDVFAIEFQMDPSQRGPLSEWWGSLWLWVESRCIGNTEEKEMVSVGLGSLVTAAQKTGLRASHLLSSMPAKEALELVMWAVYGEDDPNLEQLVGNRANLYPFEILPAADPFFDDWQAILIEEKDTERFIYRKMDQTICAVKWKLGTFRDVAVQAQADFETIAKLWER